MEYTFADYLCWAAKLFLAVMIMVSLTSAFGGFLLGKYL